MQENLLVLGQAQNRLIFRLAKDDIMRARNLYINYEGDKNGFI